MALCGSAVELWHVGVRTVRDWMGSQGGLRHVQFWNVCVRWSLAVVFRHVKVGKFRRVKAVKVSPRMVRLGNMRLVRAGF